MDVKNTHSVTKTEISVFGRQALDAERRRSPSLAGKVLIHSDILEDHYSFSKLSQNQEDYGSFSKLSQNQEDHGSFSKLSQNQEDYGSSSKLSQNQEDYGSFSKLSQNQ